MFRIEDYNKKKIIIINLKAYICNKNNNKMCD